MHRPQGDRDKTRLLLRQHHNPRVSTSGLVAEGGTRASWAAGRARRAIRHQLAVTFSSDQISEPAVFRRLRQGTGASGSPSGLISLMIFPVDVTLDALRLTLVFVFSGVWRKSLSLSLRLSRLSPAISRARGHRKRESFKKTLLPSLRSLLSVIHYPTSPPRATRRFLVFRLSHQRYHKDHEGGSLKRLGSCYLFSLVATVSTTLRFHAKACKQTIDRAAAAVQM